MEHFSKIEKTVKKTQKSLQKKKRHQEGSEASLVILTRNRIMGVVVEQNNLEN